MCEVNAFFGLFRLGSPHLLVNSIHLPEEYCCTGDSSDAYGCRTWQRAKPSVSTKHVFPVRSVWWLLRGRFDLAGVSLLGLS